MKYILYDELQDFMERHYQQTGHMLSFASALKMALEQNISHQGPMRQVDFSRCDMQNKDEINRYVGQIAIPYLDSAMELENSRSLQDPMIVFKYPRYSRAGIHVQDGLELNYVYSGSCTLFFEGDEYTIQENEVIIIPPNTSHDLYDTEDSIVFSCLLNQSVFYETFFQVIRTDTPLATYYEMCLYHFAKTFLSFQIQEPMRFMHTFMDMYSESATEKEYRFEICTNYMRILLAYLLRQPQPSVRYESSGSASNVLSKMPIILHYIKSNYQTVTMSFLAEFFHYHRSHLGKLIKKYTNLSFSELVTKYRLDHALMLLMNSSETIERIAEEAGYQSADHFSRMFKRKYGCSPNKYRKRFPAISSNPDESH